MFKWCLREYLLPFNVPHADNHSANNKFFPWYYTTAGHSHSKTTNACRICFRGIKQANITMSNICLHMWELESINALIRFIPPFFLSSGPPVYWLGNGALFHIHKKSILHHWFMGIAGNYYNGSSHMREWALQINPLKNIKSFIIEPIFHSKEMTLNASLSFYWVLFLFNHCFTFFSPFILSAHKKLYFIIIMKWSHDIRRQATYML